MVKRNTLSKLLVKMLLIAIILASTVGVMACNPKYKVSFDVDGGTPIATITVKKGSTINESDIGTTTKEGFNFEKWVRSDGSTFVLGQDTVKGEMTLKAVWNIITYNVTFVTGQGATVVEPQTINYNELATEPTAPTKEGFVFTGWYTDQTYKTAFDFSTNILNNTTLYAQFLTKIDKPFTVDFEGSDTEIPQMLTDDAGVVHNLPVATKEGATFVGWWMSDFYDQTKLSRKYDGRVLTENTTLYAVFNNTFNGPIVSANDTEITWESLGVNVNYSVKVTAPDGTPQGQTLSALRYAYDFTQKPKGEYVIEVTANGKTSTVYYHNYALSRVSQFEVEEDSFIIKFNPVANAQSYLLYIDCASDSPAHTSAHQPKDNGELITYDFTTCIMGENGIVFTVHAIADGYVTSISEPYVFKRWLDEVEAQVNLQTEQVTWGAVEHADYYMVKIDDGEFIRHDVLNTISFKNYAPSTINVSIYAVGHGYISPAPTVFAYEKNSMKAPSQASFVLDNSVLSWDAIEGATNGYIVKVNGQEISTPTNSIDLSSFGGVNIEVSVKTAGAGEYTDSLYSNSKVYASSLEDQVSYDEGIVSWSSIIGATSYEVRVNGGTPKAVDSEFTQTEIELTQDGTNEIEVRYLIDSTPSAWEKIEVTAFKISLHYNHSTSSQVLDIFRAANDPLNLPDSSVVSVTGYTLRFWSAEQAGVQYSGVKAPANNLTLYAQWEPNRYTITFDFNGMESAFIDNNVTSFEVTYNSAFTAPVANAGDHAWMFNGWTTQNGNTFYTDREGVSANPWTIDGEVTFYANWMQIFEFTLIEDGTKYSVAGGAGAALLSEITIPVTYNDLPVTFVRSDAFANRTNLKIVNIPNTIELIEIGINGGNAVGSAFAGCTNLEYVNVYEVENNYEIRYQSFDGLLVYINENTNAKELKYFPMGKRGEYEMPSGVETISINVFKNTLLTSITIPESVTSIANTAFSTCVNLESVIFKSGNGYDLVLGANIFEKSPKLTRIDLPARLSTFDMALFSAIDSLEEINFVGNGGKYSSINGFVTNLEKTTLLYSPRAKSGSFSTPDGITTIAQDAFSNPVITYVKEIAYTNYYGTNITSIYIKAAVKVIERGAFKGNTSMNKLDFEGGGTDLTIAEEAFYGCRNLTEVSLPDYLSTLKANAFGDTQNLLKVTTNARVTTGYEAGAFADIPQAGVEPNTYVKTLHLGPSAGMVNINTVFGIKVESVTVDTSNATYKSVDGVLYRADLTLIAFYPTGRTGNFTIPNTVTSIQDNVFEGKFNLSGVRIPNSITKIGKEAFKDCTGLTYVEFIPGSTPLTIDASAFYNCVQLSEANLPDRLTSIGERAFYNCKSLPEITIPQNVTVINDYTFANCDNLSSVNIQQGVTTIGDFAFNNCISLRSISIPASVTTFDGNIFDIFGGCDALASIRVLSGNANFASLDDVLYEKEGGVITKLTFCPASADGASGTITIPNTVTSINQKAFFGNKGVETIQFADGRTADVFTIGTDAFNGCLKLKELSLPTGLETMQTGLFTNCAVLEKVFIPNTVNSMQTNIFNGCAKLSTIEFETGNTTNALTLASGSSGNGVFVGCTGLETLTLPERTTSIGSYAFGDYSVNGVAAIYKLETVNIPASVTSIGSYAFGNKSSRNNLTTVNIATGSQLRTISSYAFYNCQSLTNINLPNSIAEINEYAFASSSMARSNKVATLNLGSITKINQKVFSYSGLQYITIPAAVETIDQYAFENSRSLTNIYFSDSGLKVIQQQAFINCSSLQTITIPRTVTSIFTRAFYGCSSLESINFASNTQGYASLTLIGINAFSGSGLKTFTFPEVSTTSINYYGSLFNGAKNLTTITLSSTIDNNSQASIQGLLSGSYATTINPGTSTTYKNHASLPLIVNANGNTIYFALDEVGVTVDGEFRVPNNTTSISSSAFSGQARIKKLIIPSSVRTISSGAFANCSNLEEVVFEGTGITSIGSGAFQNCSSLKRIDLSGQNGLSIINDFTFQNCPSLEEVTLPSSIRTIGSSTGYAFSFCTSLKTINIDGVTTFNGTGNFRYTGFDEFVLPTGLLKLGSNTFEASAIKKITFQSNITDFGSEVFLNCVKLETVILDSTMELIGSESGTSASETFKNCPKLKYIHTYNRSTDTTIENSLPIGISTIPASTFENCTSLVALDISNVTTIGNYAFRGATSLQTITLSNSLTRLGNYMFDACSSLRTITLPSNLSNIGTYTFRNSAIESIVIPSGVSTIGESVFSGCASLTSVTLSEELASIGANTFLNNAKLTKITYSNHAWSEGNNSLPIGLNSIGDNAFKGATALTNIHIPNLLAIGTSVFEGATNLTKVTFDNQLESLGNAMFKGTTSLSTVALPTSLKFMGTSTFQNGGLTQIVIPAGVVHLGTTKNNTAGVDSSVSIFAGCANLVSVTLPAELLSMGGNIFKDCTSLTKITYTGHNWTDGNNALPTKLNTIANSAFAGCKSLTNITLTNAIFGTYVFSGNTSLRTVRFNANTTTLGNYMFNGCTSLANVTLPANFATINEGLFFGSGLETITIGAKVNAINKAAFSDCKNLNAFVVDPANSAFYVDSNGILFDSNNVLLACPQNIEGTLTLATCTTISAYAFYGLTNVTGINFTSNTLTTIGDYAFYGSGVEVITIPETVISIGNYAFAKSALRTVAIMSQKVAFGTNIFDGCVNLESVTLNGYITSLGNYMFKGCTSLKSITLPTNLTFMGTFTFQNSGLVSVVIPENVLHLGSSAGTKADSTNVGIFDGCQDLESVTLPANLLSIGAQVFKGTSSLETLIYSGYTGTDNVLPASVTFVGGYAFQNSGLESLVVLGQTQLADRAFQESGFETVSIENVTNFGTHLFYNAKKLNDVTLNNSIPALSNYMFAGTDSLATITLPAGLQFMGIFTFQNSGLVSIVIPESVENFGRTNGTPAEHFTGEGNNVAIFDGSKKLQTVVLPSNLQTIGNFTFRNCTSLTNLTYTGQSIAGNALPSTTSLVGQGAFEGSGIKQITLHEDIVKFGIDVFKSSGIEEVTIKTTLDDATIAWNMFEDCTSLRVVNLAEGITVRDYMFKGCTGLTEIVLPAGTTVGSGAFFGWTSNQTIKFVGSEYTAMNSWNSKAYSVVGGLVPWWGTNCTATMVWDYTA